MNRAVAASSGTRFGCFRLVIGMGQTQHISFAGISFLLCGLVAYGSLVIVQAACAQSRSASGSADTGAGTRGLFYKKQSGETPIERVGRIAVRLVENERERDVRLDHIFRTGDEIRFKISSNRDGWLYVINRTPKGEFRLLWPPENTVRPAENAVEAHEDVMVPPAPSVFAFDKETGTEQLYVFIRSERKPPQLAAIQPQPGGAGSESRPSSDQGAPLAPRIARERIVDFAVRGVRGSGASSTVPVRGMAFVPGDEDPDPHLYFRADCGPDEACDVLWEFELNHE